MNYSDIMIRVLLFLLLWNSQRWFPPDKEGVKPEPDGSFLTRSDQTRIMENGSHNRGKWQPESWKMENGSQNHGKWQPESW